MPRDNPNFLLPIQPIHTIFYSIQFNPRVSLATPINHICFLILPLSDPLSTPLPTPFKPLHVQTPACYSYQMLPFPSLRKQQTCSTTNLFKPVFQPPMIPSSKHSISTAPVSNLRMTPASKHPLGNTPTMTAPTNHRTFPNPAPTNTPISPPTNTPSSDSYHPPLHPLSGLHPQKQPCNPYFPLFIITFVTMSANPYNL